MHLKTLGKTCRIIVDAWMGGQEEMVDIMHLKFLELGKNQSYLWMHCLLERI